jgi:iron(III) transport system ATP-binding protein
MNAGKIEQSGPPDEIYRRPATRFVADFIGRANFLSGEVLSVAGDSVDISVMGVPMTVPAGAGNRQGAAGTIVVRPETISVGTGELRAHVTRSTFLGSHVEYELDLGADRERVLAGDGEWMARGLHAPGDEITWELLPERSYVLPVANAEE